MEKLIQTLQSLTPSEFSSLGHYMRSPYFGSHGPTLELFDFLEPRYPDFEGDLFAGFSQSCHEGRLAIRDYHLLKTYLLRKVHDFLAQEEWQSQGLASKEALIASLVRRGHYREAERQLERAERQLATETPLDSNNHFHHVRLLEFALELNFSQQMRSGNPPLSELRGSLDALHVGIQLKYLLPALTLQRLLGKPFPEARWAQCRATVEADPDCPPLSAMFYHLICLLRGEGKDHFEKLVALLDAHSEGMSRVERMNVYGYLQNHITQRQGEGDPAALRQLFQLYQRMERERLIFGRGNFTEHLVRNIIITACRLGEFEWAETFLEGNQAAIEDSGGANVYAYVRAFLHFYTGQFSEALRELQELRFKDPFYRTGHQTLLLRIYYELRDQESLEGLAQTFRRYLNRSSSMSERQKDWNRKFISVVQLLARARESGLSPYRRRRIEECLSGPAALTDRTWLAAKYAELNP